MSYGLGTMLFHGRAPLYAVFACDEVGQFLNSNFCKFDLPLKPTPTHTLSMALCPKRTDLLLAFLS